MVKDPKKKNHHSHLALFAGMGGFIAASNRVGFKTVFANEIEGSCLNVLRESFPNLTISAEDIRNISQDNLPDLQSGVDVLSAGFPAPRGPVVIKALMMNVWKTFL